MSTTAGRRDDAMSSISRLHAVAAGLARAGTAEEVAQVLAREGRLAIGAAQASVWIPSTSGDSVRLASFGVPPERLEEWPSVPFGADVPVAEVLRTGEEVWVASARELIERYPTVRRSRGNEGSERGALAVVPLALRGNTLAALSVRFAEDVELEDDDRAMLVSIARTGALALERAFLLDATREARDRAEWARERVERLQVVTSSFASAMTEDDIINVLLRESPASLGARVALVYLLDDDGLHIVGAVGLEPDQLEIAMQAAEEGGAPSNEAVAAGEATWVDDRASILARYPSIASVVEEVGIGSTCSIPIESGGTLLGSVGLWFAEEHSFDEDRRQLLIAIARQAALALQRVRLVEADRENETRLGLLVDSNVIGTVVADDQIVTDANDAFLEMIGRTRDELERGTLSWREMTPPEFADVDARAVRQLLNAGRAEPFEKEYLRPDGGRVPVLLGLALLNARPFRCIGFVLDLTERKTVEAERLRLLEEERRAREEGERARERLAFLAEASAVLARSLDYRATLSRLARLLVPRLATMCTIDLINETGALEALALAHEDPEKEAFARHLREKLPPRRGDTFGTWAAIESNRSQLLEEIPPGVMDAALERSPEIADDVRGLEIASAMVVPLAAAGRAFGAISLVRTMREERFSAEDLALAQELARRAAVAVENARLFEEGRRVADILQRSLLPPTLPEIPGIEVAGMFRVAMDSAMIGGDFYDVFTSGAGSWVAGLGDIMGKGAPAAAVMGVARQAIRAAALAQQGPTQILRTVNESLLQQTEPERFATIACARVRPRGDRSRVTVACGGHPPPLVLRADGTVEEITCMGTVIGVLPDPEVIEVDTELAPGDTLVLYSDGVTDEHVPGGEEFGPERLESLLRDKAGNTAEEIARAIVEAVEAFAGGDPEDDVTVLALRVRPYGRVLERVLAAEASSIHEARNALEELRFRVGKDVLDDVRLLVSELVTNAIRHAGLTQGDHITLLVDLEPEHIRVECADPGPGFDLDEARTYADSREGLPDGWGLRLVEEVADRWGVESDENGSHVWFELARGAG